MRKRLVLSTPDAYCNRDVDDPPRRFSRRNQPICFEAYVEVVSQTGVPTWERIGRAYHPGS